MELVELISILENIFAKYGYSIVFLASFIEITPFGWTIPGGAILAIAGFFAYGASFSLLVVLVLGWLGAWLVLLLAYYLGLKTGYRLVKFFKQEKNAERAKILLREHGGVILTTSMLASLTRFWVAYVAGMQKYGRLKFLFYSAVASLTWSSLMIVIGYLAGSERSKLEIGIARLGILGWILFLIVLGVIYWKIRKGFGELKEV